MFKLIPNLKSIGLEKTANGIKVAEIEIQSGNPVIMQLQTIPAANVNPLYNGQPILTTGLDGYEVLLRNLQLPLTKDKDIEAALIFQAEPILPYPIEEALLARQTLAKSPESTELTLFATKKDVLQNHLDQWQQFEIEPEKISCLQAALCLFGKAYLSAVNSLILVHIQDSTTACVLIQAGKLIAAYSHQEGLNLVQGAAEEDSRPDFAAGLSKLQKIVAKMTYALVKELKGLPADGIVLTGDGVRLPGLKEALFKNLPVPLFTEENLTEDQLCYAVPIGLALNSLPSENETIDFRQAEFTYPRPWKRLTIPLAGYFVSMLILSAAFYFFGNYRLQLEENEVKQNYVDLLASMGKSYDQFEGAYLAKNGAAREKSGGEALPIASLDREDLQDRLSYIQNDIQSIPDTFPLYANVPRVSDVLAWLSSHPAVFAKNKEGEHETRLLLESLVYAVVKRPEHNKKQEKYQVKIDLEFSTTTPKWAREFHDALIAPNDYVDPKGEIKWNANRGLYKTSFYLKDKTSYL